MHMSLLNASGSQYYFKKIFGKLRFDFDGADVIKATNGEPIAWTAPAAEDGGGSTDASTPAGTAVGDVSDTAVTTENSALPPSASDMMLHLPEFTC